MSENVYNKTHYFGKTMSNWCGVKVPTDLREKPYQAFRILLSLRETVLNFKCPKKVRSAVRAAFQLRR